MQPCFPGSRLCFLPVGTGDATGEPLKHGRDARRRLTCYTTRARHAPGARDGAFRTAPRRPAMDDTVRRITAEDINPRFNWGRALPALGIMGVDFEERVDYRRLHRYRLSRVKHGAGEVRPRRAAGASTSTTSATSPRPRSASGSATSSRAGRCSPAPASRSCGISARPPCITSSTRPGSRRRTARPGSSACAAPCIPPSG